MKVAHNKELEWTQWPSIRGDTANVQLLLQGKSGEIDDYELMLSRIEGTEQHSPRHRHVFDQFRCALDQDIPLGPGIIPKGCIAFIPEGTPYGPFSLPKNLMMLSLQFGGPSGQGHVHTQDLLEAYAKLANEGSFDKGVYTWTDAEGKKHNKDAHKAVWERITGREVHYPAPRILDPVVINPDNYQWIVAGPGVAEKLLGVFNERGTYARMLRIEPHASYARPAGKQANICFIKEGACTIEQAGVDQNVLQKWDSFRAEPDESVTITALEQTTLLMFGMPHFSNGEG